MMEAEKYWRGLVEKLEAVTARLRPGGVTMDDEPRWVDRLTWELANMISPKLQLRAGIEPTPDKIGVMIGCHLTQMAQARMQAALPKPQTEAGRIGFEMGQKLGTPPGIDPGWYGAALKQFGEVEELTREVIKKILVDRPLTEATEFFRGLSRGLKDNRNSLVPVMENGRPTYSDRQFELLRRVMVYTVARHNWRELDKLETSQQAFEWFSRRVPGELLGDDPERIRKMFYRVGKRFKTPGRPKKGTPRR